MSGEGATASSDVFSFGVVLWELLTWDIPWLKDNPWSIVHIVGNGGRLQIPSRWDLPGDDTPQFQGLDDYIALMQQCWAQNVYDRPSFGEIVQELRALESMAPSLGGAERLDVLPSGVAVMPTISMSQGHSDSISYSDEGDAHASISSTAVAAGASLYNTRSMQRQYDSSQWRSHDSGR